MDPAAETPPNPQVVTIIANIAELMNEAERMLCDSTSQHAEEQVELLRARYDDLQVHLSTLCASAGRALSVSAHRADRVIRAHPYESLALALGAGALLGALWARRD